MRLWYSVSDQFGKLELDRVQACQVTVHVVKQLFLDLRLFLLFKVLFPLLSMCVDLLECVHLFQLLQLVCHLFLKLINFSFYMASETSVRLHLG